MGKFTLQVKQVGEVSVSGETLKMRAGVITPIPNLLKWRNTPKSKLNEVNIGQNLNTSICFN